MTSNISDPVISFGISTQSVRHVKETLPIFAYQLPSAWFDYGNSGILKRVQAFVEDVCLLIEGTEKEKMILWKIPKTYYSSQTRPARWKITNSSLLLTTTPDACPICVGT
jgi:hypothetical protein